MTLQQQKDVLLDILIDFARFCERNNLSYFLDAGTLLGAIRHSGFIPWDDDIDLCMPQQDYFKLCEIAKKNRYCIADHISVDLPGETLYPYIKISDMRTMMIEFPEKNPMEVAVYLDIFPKFGIKDDGIATRCVCKLNELLSLALWFNVFTVDAWQRKDSPIWKKIVAKYGSWLVSDKNRYKPVKIQYRLLKWYAKRHPLESCRYVTTLTNGEFNKRAPKECFESHVEVSFEGHKFKAPAGYDTYLKCLYPGDYMVLPSVEKRIGHKTECYWKSEVK